ncbi:MAG TPA: hypothetical protein VIF43_02630 [Patescibacteria group bacterium]|jgi:hypothetical protein
MNPHEQKAVVESVSARTVTLRLGDRRFEWPREQAPDVRKGDTVVVRLLSEAQAETDRHEQARVVLKELLGGER